MAKIFLITGGARSGKSSFALELAEMAGQRRLFVATCPGLDGEMIERIQRHQQERQGRGWHTLETETDLTGVFQEKSNSFDVILIDCLTLWINNILFQQQQKGNHVDDAVIGRLCRQWLDQAEHYRGTVTCVTNEVGLGIVPDNEMARRYRDLVGTCNQILGRRADEVILVSCGLPLYLKKSTPEKK